MTLRREFVATLFVLYVPTFQLAHEFAVKLFRALANAFRASVTKDIRPGRFALDP